MSQEETMPRKSKEAMPWDLIRAGLKRIYHDDVLLVVGDKAFINVKGSCLARISTISDTVVGVSLRASMFPSDAAMIGIILSLVATVKIEDHFEYRADGSIAYGEEAITCAIQRMAAPVAEREEFKSPEFLSQKSNPN